MVRLLLPRRRDGDDHDAYASDAPSASSSHAPQVRVCAECRIEYTKATELEAHARRTKHKAYQCEHGNCGKMFAKRTNFVRHNQTHRRPKPHACQHCDKRFHRTDNLAEHIAICPANVANDYRTGTTAADSQDSSKGTSQTSMSDQSQLSHYQSQTSDDLVLNMTAPDLASMASELAAELASMASKLAAPETSGSYAMLPLYSGKLRWRTPAVSVDAHKIVLAASTAGSLLHESTLSEASPHDRIISGLLPDEAGCILAMYRLWDYDGNLEVTNEQWEQGALFTAARRGWSTAIIVLCNAGVDLDTARPHTGGKALHTAAYFSNARTVRVLACLGADINCRNDGGATPLHEAVTAKNIETVHALLSLDADLDATDILGNTPLHVAAEGSAMDFYNLLLRAGADTTIQDWTGKTAAELMAGATWIADTPGLFSRPRAL